jgi:hypothetical protein
LIICFLLDRFICQCFPKQVIEGMELLTWFIFSVPGPQW